MTPVFVAFGHRKRVGKDLAGRLLCSHLRLNFKGSNIQSHGFADALKDMLYILYKWADVKPAIYYEENEAEKEKLIPALGKTYRELCISFGNRMREVYPDTWIDLLYHNLNCDVCIIRDLRYPNEADRIHHYGGYVYRIDRAAAPNNSDEADDALLEYPNWDDVLINNGTIAEFNKKIVSLGERLCLHLKGKQNASKEATNCDAPVGRAAEALPASPGQVV